MTRMIRARRRRRSMNRARVHGLRFDHHDQEPEAYKRSGQPLQAREHLEESNSGYFCIPIQAITAIATTAITSSSIIAF